MFGAPSGAFTGCGKSGFEFGGRSPDDAFELRVRVGQHGDVRRPGVRLGWRP